MTTTASITDFRKEMQTQINEIVGNAVAKGRLAKASKMAPIDWQICVVRRDQCWGRGSGIKIGVGARQSIVGQCVGVCELNVDSRG